MASMSSSEEKAWLVLCCGQLYRPTGESHWVSCDGSYLFRNGEEEKDEESAPSTISAAVASSGVLCMAIRDSDDEDDDEAVLSVGYCFER